jgi:hypothetical protein
MKKFLIMFLLMLPLTGVAMENKIKFDSEIYNLSVNVENGYNYYPKGENSDNWHSKITIKKLDKEINPTQASAEFAHEIQAEHSGASVLVYPDAGMVGYLLPNEHFYEYNAVYFEKDKEFSYGKRFYSSECDARKEAIEFAEKYNKKYMELVSKEAKKY